MAHRLTLCVREADTVARIGGDEFVVMLSELDEDEKASIAHAGVVA
ncbi:MAG: diguanylate cyclase, partial [Hydrogenophaga sp.]|nr:diguanylate cyclase [Hydrogenophaga sp.]